MKGVILAGGTGSRLYPLTKVTNKHLLPIGRFPMIYYSLYKLIQCNIKDIFIVTNARHLGDMANLMGSGKQFGVNLYYKVQDKPGGISEALGLLEDIYKDEKMIVLLGDNIFKDSLVPYVNKFLEHKEGAMVLLKEVSDPIQYGVAEIKDGRIISIEEKPENPKSKLSVSGIYMYDQKVFKMIRKINPSRRGEMEITDVNYLYLEKDLLYYDILSGWWVDAGTFPSFGKAAQLVMETDMIRGMHKLFDSF